MIDTICLLIPKSKLKLLNAANWDLHSKTEQYVKFVRNPSKKEKETGNYYPRLTGYNRRFAQEPSIRVEFSAPKLLYLNNLDEVENSDFPMIVEILQKRIREMGIAVSRSTIENASVSSVHFAKNIELKDGYTCSYLISEMNKANIRKSFDFAKTRFINDGESLYAHTTSHQFVIYDKISDLRKDKKRAIDKDQTLYQKSLFAELNREKGLLEVLRFEVRLGQKQKLNKVLAELGYSPNPTFKQVFNAEMSRKIVKSYWDKLIMAKNSGIFSLNISIKDALRAIYLYNPNIKPKQAIYYLGLYFLSRDETGMRQLRSITTKRSQDRTWYRTSKDSQLVREIIANNKLRDWVQQIDDALTEFRVYRNPSVEV